MTYQVQNRCYTEELANWIHDGYDINRIQANHLAYRYLKNGQRIITFSLVNDSIPNYTYHAVNAYHVLGNHQRHFS